MITTTASTLQALRIHCGLSQRKTARIATRAIGPISQASISLMEAGKAPVNAQYEAWLRVQAGERAVTVPACPDCGSVHHVRCNGVDGRVVVLGNGDKVVKAAPLKRRDRQAQRERRAAQNARRTALGAKWLEVIEAGLTALESKWQKDAARP